MPSIHLKTWPTSATLFEGEVAAGPVPTLFATDVDAATAAISADVARAHWDINKLAKLFLVAESLSMKEALNIMKKPR